MADILYARQSVTWLPEALLICGFFGTAAVLVLAAVRHFWGKRIPPALMGFLWVLVGLRFLLPAAVPVGNLLPGDLRLPDFRSPDLLASLPVASSVETETVQIPPETAPAVLPVLPETLPMAEILPAEPSPSPVTEPETTAPSPAVPPPETSATPAPPVYAETKPAESRSELAPAPSDTSAAEDRQTIPVTVLLALVWVTGTLGLAGWFLLSHIRLRYRLRGGERCDDCTLPPLLRPVTVKRMSGLPSPMTVGILRPLILLPAGEQPDQAVLYHEFCHIRRFDGLTKLFALATAVVHWWNPVVWLYVRLLHRDMELACDRAAVKMLAAADGAAIDYARTLLDYAERRQSLRLGLHFGQSGLKERIDMLLDRKKTSPVLCAVLCAAMTLTLVCCGPAVEDNHDALVATLAAETAKNQALEAAIAEKEATRQAMIAEWEEENQTSLYLQQLMTERHAQTLTASEDYNEAIQKQHQLQKDLVEASALLSELTTNLPSIYIPEDQPDTLRTSAKDATSEELQALIRQKEEQIAVAGNMLDCLTALRALCNEEADVLAAMSAEMGAEMAAQEEAGKNTSALLDRQAAIVTRWYTTGRRDIDYATQIDSLQNYLLAAKGELARYKELLAEKQAG